MKKFLMPALLALLLFTAGCDQPPVEPPPPAEKPTQTAQVKPEVKPESKPEIKLEPPKTEPIPVPEVRGENLPVANERTEKSISVKVYYPDDSGMRLVAVEREILVDNTTDKYTAAVEALLDEPEEENLTRIFPKNAAIRSVTVANGLATVDLDGNITKGFVGGSTGEEFLVGSVVNTLTNFPEVQRVKFLVDGQDIETLSGHMDLSAPLERMSDLTK